jgi:hypothetical protein
VKAGERLVEVTSSSFKQVAETSGKVVVLVGEIAAASQEQSQGISEVNKAVVEMSTVTQQNAASSEELAATMAMFRTNYTGVKNSSRRKGPVKVGKSFAALPDRTGADNRFNRHMIAPENDNRYADDIRGDRVWIYPNNGGFFTKQTEVQNEESTDGDFVGHMCGFWNDSHGAGVDT